MYGVFALKYRNLFIFCCFLMFTLPTLAADLKIGFVNVVKIMDSAPQVEEANKRLEKEFAPKEKSIQKQQQEASRLEERINKDGSVMSDDELKRVTRQLQDLQRDLVRDQEDARRDLNIRRNEELSKLQKQIFDVIQTFAKEDDYDLILTDGVVWASEKIDITDDVLKRLRQ